MRPYKFQIIAVCQVIENEQVVGEQALASEDGQPLVVFGLDGLREFADNFEARISETRDPVPAVRSVN